MWNVQLLIFPSDFIETSGRHESRDQAGLIPGSQLRKVCLHACAAHYYYGAALRAKAGTAVRCNRGPSAATVISGRGRVGRKFQPGTPDAKGTFLSTRLI